MNEPEGKKTTIRRYLIRHPHESETNTQRVQILTIVILILRVHLTTKYRYCKPFTAVIYGRNRISDYGHS